MPDRVIEQIFDGKRVIVAARTHRDIIFVPDRPAGDRYRKEYWPDGTRGIDFEHQRQLGEAATMGVSRKESGTAGSD